MMKVLWRVKLGWCEVVGLVEVVSCSAASAERMEEWTRGPSIAGWFGPALGEEEEEEEVVVVVVASLFSKPSTSRVMTTFRRPLSGRRRSGIESQVLRPMMTALRRGGVGVVGVVVVVAVEVVEVVSL